MNKLEQHLMTVPKRRATESRLTDGDGKPAKFPSATYFQIHFQHIEAQLEQTNRNIEALQQQIAILECHLLQSGSNFEPLNTE